MTFDPQAIRRRTLAHCLWMAQFDEVYAAWAARERERTGGGLFKGLEARFTRDLREAKLKTQEKT